MSTPITYTTLPITEDYAYTLKKYAISTGRPTTAGYTNYRDNPNSKTWYPAFIYNQYHPNGTGYYVISNTRVQGGHATAGNEIPTFHVTGNTDTAILHLINRLPNRGSNFYTDVRNAKTSIINDPESLHFDADLSKYNYYAPQYCILNFDVGNLNCAIKSDDTTLRNLTSIADASFGNVTIGGLNDSNDNASYYHIMEFTNESLINTANPTNFAINEIDYLVAMRIRIPDLPNNMQILTDQNSNFSLDFFNANSLRLQSNNTSVVVNTTTTDFITIIFGRDVTNSTIFLYVNDTISGTPQVVADTHTANTVRFGNMILGSTSNSGDPNSNFFIGALQVWVGEEIINYSSGTMSGVGQSDFFNQIHTMYASRWS
jgi:hypothetical protein